MKSFSLFTLFLLLMLSGKAQFNIGYAPWSDLNFEVSGEIIPNAFAGGLNAPQFSEIDLNGDAKLDLVVFDRDGFSIRPFINGGTPNTIDYHFAPEYIKCFPPLKDFVLFRDYNCDGLMDLFTHSSGAFSVYKNVSTNGGPPKFQLKTSLLKSFYPDNGNEIDIFVNPSDIPHIGDINGDGLPDILSFDSQGSFVHYHENVSLDSGSCEKLQFVLKSTCWGGFRESDDDHTVDLFQSCKGQDVINGGLHSGSTLLALDADGDNDSDLLVGDASFSGMVFLTNGGDQTTATMTNQSILFPQDLPLDLTTFPAAYHLDVNNDGVSDLLAAPNAKNISENFENSLLYLNAANSNSDPTQFIFEKNKFLNDGMIDLGTGAYPLVIDIDGDGLPDLLVGNFGYYEAVGNFSSQLAYFRNTGSANAPAFQLINRDYASLSSLGLKGLCPSAGDLDDDGDMDLVLGDTDGHLHLFLNNGGAGNPADFVLNSPEWFGIDAGQFAAPQLVDVNRDGLLDLLIGERSGKIRYHQNIGTAQAPSFNATATDNQWGGIDVRIPCCTGYSSPFLTELEEAGKYFLLVGTERGTILVYEDIDGNVDGEFDLVDSIVTRTHRVSVTVGDLDNDQKNEVIYGEQTGGLTILQKVIDAPIGIIDQSTKTLETSIFPNPSSGQLQINCEAPLFSISISNALGRTVFSKEINDGANQIHLDLYQLPQGFYWIECQGKKNRSIQKWVKSTSYLH